MSQRFLHRRLLSNWDPTLMTLAVILALAGCSASTPGGVLSSGVGQTSTTVASGFIEADEVTLSSEIGGRIVSLPVAEGSDVSAHAVLVELDRGAAEAELRTAQSNVVAAQAALAMVKAGARKEEVRQAQAAVALAEANLLAAGQTRQDAQMLLGQQQSLDLQIIQAAAQVEVSRAQLKAAVSNQTAVKTMTDRSEQPFETYRTWDSWVGVNTAGATYDGAQSTLQKLQDERRASTAQKARVNAAEAAYQSAVEVVAQAKARLADLQAGPTAEQIAVAEAQVRVANAGVESAQARLSKLKLVAPVNGRVIAHNLKAGELALPGAPILTLANLDTPSLIVYVPADRLGLVRLGAPVPVQVDGYPGRTFEGKVTHIADKAEFVPDNVQSAEDRATMVFTIKLRLDNPERLLKPGMPADAHFGGA